MRVQSGRRALACVAVIAIAGGAACRRAADDPLKLDRNILTVDNRSNQDWNRVEIWVNTYYRVTTASVPAGSRFQAPLDTFVAGFGQRFDFRRAQIRDVRLTATLADGTPFELKKQFDEHGLTGALRGATGGKR
jgi:hypothetical protein